MPLTPRSAARGLAALGIALGIALGAAAPLPAMAEDGAAKKGFEPEGRLSLRQFYPWDDQTVFTTYVEDPANPNQKVAGGRRELGITPAITTVDVDVAMHRIKGTGLGFLVDAEFRKDLTSELSDPLPLAENRKGLEFGDRHDRSLGVLRSETYVKNAYAEYLGLGSAVDVRVGRLLLYELGQPWIDGAHVSTPGDRGLSLGGFGGLNPNPLDYALDADYVGGGAHAGYRGQQGEAALAFNFSSYQGKKDRAFVFSRAHWEARQGLFLSYYAVLDLFTRKAELDPKGNVVLSPDTKPRLTYGFANAAWWATPNVQFRLSLATYRNVVLASSPGQAILPSDLIALERALEEEGLKNVAERARLTYNSYLGSAISPAPYHRGKLATILKFLGHYYAYNEIDLLKREFDDRSATSLAFGLRDTNVLDSNTFLHLRFRFQDNFLSESNEVLVDLSRQFGGVLTAGLTAARLSGRSLALRFPPNVLKEGLGGLQQPEALALLTDRVEQRQEVDILGASLDIDITDRLLLSLVYELIIETATAEEVVGADPLKAGDAASGAEDLTIQSVNTRLTYRL